MSDLGDLTRLLDRFGIEHEISGAWSGLTHYKILDVPDPQGPVGDKQYGIEFRFAPEDNKFVSMTLYYEKAEKND